MTAPPLGRPPERDAHYEDLVVGETLSLGRLAVSGEEIAAFARAFDPQPLHLSEEGAAGTMIGGLCASGWHTCSLLMRLMSDAYLTHGAGLGASGIEEVRWLAPLKPGATIEGRMTVAEKRPLASRPGVGMAKIDYHVIDADAALIMTMRSVQFFKRREVAA